MVVRALFDGLVDVAPDGSVVPATATWTVEDDGLTYRFLLRPDRFHDGTAVTAEHHARSLLAVFDADSAPRFREELLGSLRGARAPRTDPPGPRWGAPDDIVTAGGVEVVGPRELVLRLRTPDPLFLHRLADPVLVPLPALARTDPEAFGREPIGNGPFRMLGPREPGAFIRLSANSEHPRPPRIDSLVLQVYADDEDRSQRWADLLAGRLQITAVPIEERANARERFGTPQSPRLGPGLHDLPTSEVYAYGFVLDVAPYDDGDLRRAISASIDREALAAALRTAGVEPADAILPPGLGGAPPECLHCRHDPALARELVAAWRDRLGDEMAEPRVTLTYPRGVGHVAVAERIAIDLERTIGLDVRLRSREFGALVREVVAGEAPLFRYGLSAPLEGDAAGISMLERAFLPDAAENWVRWGDPAITEELAAWTPTSGVEQVRVIEATILDAAAVVPLLWTRPDLVVDPAVRGFRMDPTGRWWPERVWLD
jgi:ABC-type transport system substrate-binding protein